MIVVGLAMLITGSSFSAVVSTLPLAVGLVKPTFIRHKDTAVK